MTTEYTFSAKLVQGIVSTLGALPWSQVSGLMSEVIGAVQAQENAPAPVEAHMPAPTAPRKPRATE